MEKPRSPIQETASARISPWAHTDDEARASAKKYNELRNQLGLAFRGAQQEAYEQWCAWEREADDEDSNRE